MSTDFVAHPDGTVDPPGETFLCEDGFDDSADTMSAEDWNADCADTQQRAWSLADLPEIAAYEEPWYRMRAVRIAAAASAATLGAIAAVAAMFNPPSHAGTSASTETASAPPISAEETPPLSMPTVTAQHETRDGDYLQRWVAAGLVPGNDPAEAIRLGHRWCGFMAERGENLIQMANEVQWDSDFGTREMGIGRTMASPDSPLWFTYEQAYAAVKAARDVYCPEVG